MRPLDNPIDRRSFLKLSGLLGVGVAAGAILPGPSEAVRFDRRNFKVSKTSLAMGTYVSMTLVHPSRDEAEEAMNLAFQEIDRYAGLMNRYDESTPVGHLNKEGRLKDLHPEVAKVVEKALYYHQLTRGSFDITVKPAIDLFKEKLGRKPQVLPTERELEQVLRLIGSQMLELKGHSLSFLLPGMGITLDGIAKGYIVDKAAEMLSKNHVQNYLVNAGGDIRTRGSNPEEKPWSVAIQDPFKRKEYPDIIRMGDGAVATSGNYEVYFDQEKMFHHIVNPATGLSPEALTSVSVLAPTTTEADALSTSVFVMEPHTGIRFIENLPDCECLVIDRKGRLMKSKGWKSTANV